MPAVSNEKTEFSAKIPTEMYDEFRRYFPQYGATTWFITATLETFLASVRNEPDAQERVRQSISRMVEENRDTAAVA